ncbi:WPP domain-interacting tail-anchored protein 2 [Rhododendron vialii]|uniref:WPP domain-interacting tail-anchored protein 2 n=1 Tax=Rhododendron vialii TaxID=182163 RepID=UPI00265F2587|nr:WPP domain-interacting tail-anchored protein 2 [Rhododendron vialii]
MDEYAAQNADASYAELGEIHAHEGVTFDSKDMGETESFDKYAIEVLTRVDLDLAYSSEKLVNLDKLLMHVLACENDLEAMSLSNGHSSVNLIEKALVFDFLSGFLDSEVEVLDDFMVALHRVVVDTREKVDAFCYMREEFIVMEDKLNDSEELLKQSQEQVLEISMQSVKLQRTLFAFKHNDWKYDEGTGLSGNGGFSSMDEQPKLHTDTVEQKRHILRMLEKSLGRELYLEKKLSEFKQNEEDLKLKLHLTEQVAFCMEEAAEVVWGRFLEAENTSEVLMGISKEMVGRLQINQFNQNGSMKQEDEAKWKLLDCMEQLKGRENAMRELEMRIGELITDNFEVGALREKVKLLEEKLKESDSRIKSANKSNEEKEEQLRHMESIIESIDILESRAESAEAKITQLTETNMELNEDLSFHRSTNQSNAKKLSLVEKQLRELEIQQQHTKASSEASQEQQNMLYSAIWDMEILIEELKSKVSKAEVKTENAEEQCIILSENNIELTKEVTFMRTEIERLETALEQASDIKVASAKDINVKTNVIMDMVVQLAMERERIQKQLSSLADANRILVAKLKKSERSTSDSLHEEGIGDDVSCLSSKTGATNGSCGEASEAVRESSSRNFEAHESPKDAPVYESEVGSSGTTNGATDAVLKLEPESELEAREPNVTNRFLVYLAIIVLLLSSLASYIFNKKFILSGVDT